MTTSTDWDRVERMIGPDALAQLAQKTVAIVGVGSGGGFVAQALAMSGVGHFLLIDSDTIEATNIVRHVADLRYLGRPKVEAVADLIRQRNPQASVQTINGRLEDHTEQLSAVDLVVIGVDGEQSKYRINEICREQGITAIYAGVYERGEGGDVVVIHPDGDGPCYACWASQLREDIADRDAGQELDYGMIDQDGTIAAEPALWLHVVRVAAVQGDMALNELLEGQPIHRKFPANTVILANTALEVADGITLPPYSAYWVPVRRNDQCKVCGLSEVEMETLSLDDLMANTGMVEYEDDDQHNDQLTN